MQRIRRFLLTQKSTEALIGAVAGAMPSEALLIVEQLKERRAHQQSVLQNVNWSGAALPYVTLAKAQMRGIQLDNADLRYSYFYDADLHDAHLGNALLDNANWREVKCSGADMRSIHAHYANLARADLRMTRLQGADLSFANLWTANLTGADLSGAMLHGANLHDSLCDTTTILPDGQRWTPQVAWRTYTSN